jgi:hypothetical protein
MLTELHIDGHSSTTTQVCVNLLVKCVVEYRFEKTAILALRNRLDGHRIPAGELDGRADEFRANVSFAEIFLVQGR